MEVQKQITGIILAGGKGSRIGGDKGLVLYKRKPFIGYITEALKPFVDEIIIVTNNSEYAQYNHKCVPDIIENAGPIAGIYSGLFHSKTELNIVLSCDVPLVNDIIIKKLIQGVSNNEDMVYINSSGNINPLIAIYKKRCLHSCLDALKRGEHRLLSLVDTLEAKSITIEKSLEKYIQNINTKKELKTIENDA